jgi:RNase H-like domain found in reverse transcriptase
METLKECLSLAPVLTPLDYSPSTSIIVLSVDASTTVGWGAILQQEHGDGRMKPARYERAVWSDAELKYADY